jgi:hypothetical protein
MLFLQFFYLWCVWKMFSPLNHFSFLSSFTFLFSIPPPPLISLILNTFNCTSLLHFFQYLKFHAVYHTPAVTNLFDSRSTF